MTQADVELATGIDTATLSLYENDVRQPTVRNAKILGALYGERWSRFFEERSENDRPEPKAEAEAQ